VHERIRLSVVASDKAEALHRVEELDRASRLVTSQLAPRFFTLGNGNDIAENNKVARRDLSAPINQLELELLPFGQTFETSAFDRTDVHEHIFAAIITLDKAEALLCVEKFDDALALANHLGRHSAASASATASARSAKAATSATAAESALAVAATETAAITAAAAGRGEPITTAAEAITTATTAKGIKTLFAKPVALVAATTATTSIETHKSERTFASSRIKTSGGADDSHRTTKVKTTWPLPLQGVA
jgi:hypothetical protein